MLCRARCARARTPPLRPARARCVARRPRSPRRERSRGRRPDRAARPVAMLRRIAPAPRRRSASPCRGRRAAARRARATRARAVTGVLAVLLPMDLENGLGAQQIAGRDLVSNPWTGDGGGAGFAAAAESALAAGAGGDGALGESHGARGEQGREGERTRCFRTCRGSSCGSRDREASDCRQESTPADCTAGEG